MPEIKEILRSYAVFSVAIVPEIVYDGFDNEIFAEGEVFLMKIMAIDYGDAHTGIAISDLMCTLAGYTTVINSRKAEVVVQEVQKLIAEHGVTELVLGYPKNMDGTLGPRAEKAEAFSVVLREATGLSVTLWDERRTTIDAHNILMAGGKNAKQRKKTVDAVAAALMLEGFLTRRKLGGSV